MSAAFEHVTPDGRRLRAELAPRPHTASDLTPSVVITCDAPGERAVSHRLELAEFDAMVAAIRPPTVAPEDG